MSSAILLSDLEQKLLETNATLAGQAFPVDHLYNVIAHCCPGPFTETEAMAVAPVLARVLTIEQLEFLVPQAQKLCYDAAESVAHATLEYIKQRTGGMSPLQKVGSSVGHLSAPAHWSHRHSLAPQGALLLALMWAVLPPGDLPQPNA